ncbi:DUF1616 domain-containing protein [Halococcus agarilyticus]|uniref:DUF1616 domain-containing protein n=1 Tax=Halococcus agarilyticus TaxID=1232219 RepID=UPI000678238B|nr:DUF1616 domain-containing protein [Halococcus agarilyticus]
MSRDSLSGNDTTIERYDSDASGLRGLPGDLLVVVVYAAVVGGLIGVVGGLPTVVRVVLGVPLLLVLPGYALVAALFPGRPSRTADRSSSLSRLSQRFDSARSIQERGIRWGERLALSFGVSLFTIPLLALALDLAATLLGTGSPYRTGPIVGVLVAFIVVFAVVGIVRRLSLPRSERFSVPVGYWIDDFTDGLSGSPADVLLNGVLVLSILVAAASMSYVLAVPKDGATGTNVALLNQAGGEGGDGTLVEYNESVTLTAGEPSEPITLEVENHEGEATNYTVVVQLQRLDDAGNVVGRSEVRRFESPTVPANRSWQRQHRITPSVTGERLQLEYLLYRGEPPQNPTERNAYISPAQHLSVDIVAGGGTAGADGGTGSGSSDTGNASAGGGG